MPTFCVRIVKGTIRCSQSTFFFIQNVAHDLSITLRSSHDKHATNWLQVLMERQDDTSSSCYDGDLNSYFSKKC